MKTIRWIFKPKAQKYDWCIFRKSFSVNGKDDVFVDISALDRYVLYINGRLVSRGPVRSHNFEKYYDSVDISQFVIPGKNNIVILSQYVYQCGVYACVRNQNGTVCETDETWKTKKFDSLDSMTNACCPPLEPVRLNEEWFDARVDLDVFSENYDFSGWDNAVYVHDEYGKIIPQKGGLCSHEIVYPKRYLGAAAAKEPKGFGFRLKNPGRELHPIRSCAGEVYIFNIISESEKTVEFSAGFVTKCSVNGEPVKGKAVLKAGNNLFVAYYYDSGSDPYFVFKADGGISISEIEFGKLKAKAGVLNLKLDNVFFSWAYPDSSCYKDSNGEEIINCVLSATCIDELEDLVPSLCAAEICELSAAYFIVNTSFGKFPDCSLHPSLKLKTDFVSDKCQVANPLNMLNGNAEYGIVSGNTALFLDFGSEMLGFIHFNLCASEGTVIDIMGFEVIDFNGMQYMPQNCMRYICRDGWQRYTSFHPRGFRYLCIIIRDCERPVKIGHVALESSLAMTEPVGSFSCDNQMLNKIYDMCINTARLCMSDSYIDCPGYEQVYWVNDSKVTAMVNLNNFGAYDFDYRCLEIVGQSLSQDYIKFYRNGKSYLENKYLAIGAFSSYVYGGFPLAAFHWGLQIYDYYLYSGDAEGTKKLYPALKKMLSNCDHMMSERGLFAMEGAWNLIEWSQNDLLPCCEVTANSALLAKLYKTTAELAKEFGDAEFSTICLEKSADITHAINKYCWNEQVGGYVDTVRDEFGYELYLKFFKGNGLEYEDFDAFKSYARISEQTNVIMHYCGCVRDDRKEAVKKILIDILSDDYKAFHSAPCENIRNKERRIEKTVRMGSPFLLYYFFKALADFGEYEGMVKVMLKNYSYMIECGTNTCWETFYNAGADKWTRSICHGWGSSPAIYLQSEICGIKPTKPGFKEFIFTPHLAGLNQIKTEVPTPYGKIFVEIDSERGIHKIDYPKECKLIQ